MADKFFVKPKGEGRIVRDPVTKQPLAAAGEFKPKDSYWMRRLQDSDIEETTPPKAPKQTAQQEEGK